MRKGLIAATAAIGVLAAPAVAAEEPAEKQESPAKILDEAARKVMRALELMVDSIPQYALPEINENGDIIIRRIHPKDEAEKEPPAERGAVET